MHTQLIHAITARLDSISRRLALMDLEPVTNHAQMVEYDSLSIEHDDLQAQLESLYVSDAA